VRKVMTITLGIGARLPAFCTSMGRMLLAGLEHEALDRWPRGLRPQAWTRLTLTDKAEQDDNCAKIYNKSLLYLVSHAFEDRARIPGIPGVEFAGEPLLGMEWWIEKDRPLVALLGGKMCAWVKTPNTAPEGSTDASTAQHHGDFDDDTPTVKSSLARILRSASPSTIERAELEFEHSAATWANRRALLMK